MPKIKRVAIYLVLTLFQSFIFNLTLLEGRYHEPRLEILGPRYCLLKLTHFGL